METLTHWKKQFNYEYMGSYSLSDGKDVIMTIKQTKKEQVIGTNGKKDDCFVCYFEESDKPMILNRTNCKTIEKIYKQPYVENWAGLRVVIGIDKVNAFGETVEALRIRAIKPEPLKPVDYSKEEAKLRSSKSLDELQANFTSLSVEAKHALVAVKDELKTKLI